MQHMRERIGAFTAAVGMDMGKYRDVLGGGPTKYH